MIQDIAPHKYNNTFSKEPIKDNDYVFIFEDNSIVHKGSKDKTIIHKYSEIKELLNKNENLIYLFSIDENRFYLTLDNKVGKLACFEKSNTQIFRNLKPRWLAYAGITAHQLYKWYSENLYCGKCMGALKHSSDERALVCHNCNIHKYPQISPAVIVGITNGDKLLMTKYSSGNYKNYALIAGFMEIGETLEDTVRREVMEEVGLKVKNIRYYKNQPWSFSSSLLVGYFADLDGENIVTLDKNELSEASWFKRDDIPIPDNDISLTSEMINTFINNEH